MGEVVRKVFGYLRTRLAYPRARFLIFLFRAWENEQSFTKLAHCSPSIKKLTIFLPDPSRFSLPFLKKVLDTIVALAWSDPPTGSWHALQTASCAL